MIRVYTAIEAHSEIEVDLDPQDAVFATDEHGNFMLKRNQEVVVWVKSEVMQMARVMPQDA